MFTELHVYVTLSMYNVHLTLNLDEEYFISIYGYQRVHVSTIIVEAQGAL